MFVYGVEHKASGEILPLSYSKGGTYWSPPYAEKAEELPRLFPTKKSANAFIIAWARGYAKVIPEYDYWGNISSAAIDYEDRGRSRSDLAVITFELEKINDLR